jgi:hypothetical protein
MIRSEEDMKENEEEKLTSISKAKTLNEIAEFWDSHSLDDYWDQTHEAEFDLRVKRRRRITLTPEIYERIEAQAHERGVLPETLVNLWLAERLSDQIHKAS